jgi:transcriptional regulator with XRE-family HTH domain
MISRPLHPLDIHIGKRLRHRRKTLGLSQDELGKKIGVTFQQIQKYERGINSINAHRLYDVALVLGVTPAFFYEGYGSEEQTIKPENLSPQGLHLIQNYFAIPSAKVKHSIAALVREMAKGGDHGL